MIGDDSVAQLMLDAQSLEDLADQLVAAANAAGGRDNISVLLARAAMGGEKKSMMSRLLGN